MPDSNPPRQPGDLLLDRYFPDADHETRERARRAFAEYARVLERLGEKVSAKAKSEGKEGPEKAQRPVANAKNRVRTLRMTKMDGKPVLWFKPTSSIPIGPRHKTKKNKKYQRVSGRR